MNKYRYREVKNYIHNELKLTKEDRVYDCL